MIWITSAVTEQDLISENKDISHIMTKCFHRRLGWMVSLYLRRYSRQKTPYKEGQAMTRMCVSENISQSPGHRAASICAYWRSVDHLQWKQFAQEFPGVQQGGNFKGGNK